MVRSQSFLPSCSFTPRFHALSLLFCPLVEEWFWSGRECKGPLPSLALVSIVFVLLASVQKRFSLFFPESTL